ncbi:MAG: GNAT family N-acetyltransferase [Oligoflexales bacterium]|nr:GNAT family N-acetyltransferase [Oligoflexales bacterium]
MKPNINFSGIQTSRLKIRKFSDEDLPELLAYRNNPELSKYSSWELPFTPTHGITLINQNLYMHPDSPGKTVSLGIELRESGELIGELSLKTDPIDTSQVEFSITVIHRHQNQGLASEATKSIFNYLFHRRGKNKVKTLSDARNLKLIAFFKKIGMQQEAFFRENLFNRDRWCDQCLLAILKRDWLHPQAPSKLDFSQLFNNQ